MCKWKTSNFQYVDYSPLTDSLRIYLLQEWAQLQNFHLDSEMKKIWPYVGCKWFSWLSGFEHLGQFPEGRSLAGPSPHVKSHLPNSLILL